MSENVLELSGIQKRFGGVVALGGAGLQLRRGEVHALVGENGAGKSTLINIATGLFRPDAGSLCLNGEEVVFHSTQDAAKRGVHVVHQEADLFKQLSIAENMLLGQGLVRNGLGLIRWGETYRAAEQMVAGMGERFDVREEAGGLAVARRTMAEIAAAVASEPKVLFLDEPTSSLTLKEIENLFKQIRRLRDAGVGIVYVSHRLEEILELCDRVTVMRDGATIGTHAAAELTLDQIVSMMVGRDVKHAGVKRPMKKGALRLSVNSLSGAEGTFQDISLDVHAGEIVGLYGFVGAGRSEFAQALFGLRPSTGTIQIDGKAVVPRSPQHAVREGIAYLPEDRLVQGIFRGHALRSNASVTILRRFSRLFMIAGGHERAMAAQTIKDMNVRASSMEQPIGTLSGGNQQKVVFGRWRATAPKVLLLDEPTRGVDVGAKAEIHKLVCDLAEDGAAVVLISSELPEIMAMSDRVVTLSEGRKTGDFDPAVHGHEAIAAAAVPRSAEGPRKRKSAAATAIMRALQMRELGLIAFIFLLSCAMAFLKPTAFFNASNLLDVLANAALPAIMAQGAMLIICTGGIDISVGSMMGLCSAAAAMTAKAGWPPSVCLALSLALGVGFSLVNASAALIARIHPIIVTLAGITIYRGFMRILTEGREVVLLPEAYRALADGRLLGIPKLCYYVAGVTLLSHLLLRYTLTGRRVLALGNSENAAHLIGLSKARLTLFVFGASGALVGLAAVLQAGYYGKVQANTGQGMELQAIAAAVIGGTNILGGRGSAFGALFGAFLVALLYNALVLMEASSYWQNIFVGGLILLAVLADALAQRLRRAAA